MARGEHYHVQLQTKKTDDYSSVIIVQTSDKVERSGEDGRGRWQRHNVILSINHRCWEDLGVNP